MFVPLLMAHRLDPAALVPAALAFAAFCLVASAVYLANDIADLRADRLHPRKRHRPVASGALALPFAGCGAVVLAMSGLLLAAKLGPEVLWLMLGYAGLSLAYSLGLKRLMWVDLGVLAGLHLMRIVAGGLATGIVLSPWLLAFSSAVFLALAAMKRQGELVALPPHGVALRRGYARRHLPAVARVAGWSAAASVAVLAFYVASPAVTGLYGRAWLMVLLVPLIGGWLWHMARETRSGRMGDDPLIFAATDWVSLVVAALLPLVVLGAM